MKRILLASCAALSAVTAASAAISSYRDGLPCCEDGFGVVRNFYQSGRIACKVSAINGLFHLGYIGRQDFNDQTFISHGAENSVYARNLQLEVTVDGVPYRLPFGETVHYPFGYTSRVTVGGVGVEHSLVLDRNAVFRRVRVVENPAGRAVRARLVQMNVSLGHGVKPFVMNAARTGLETTHTDAKGVVTRIEIGATAPTRLRLNDRPLKPLAFGDSAGLLSLRYDLDLVDPSDDAVFYLVCDRAEGEELSAARVDRVFSGFAASRAGDLRFETGDPVFDNTLSYIVPMSAQFEVDGAGAFRASPTYWVWGWDAMVHAETLALAGRADEVKRMLGFFRRVADPEKGILHMFPTDFTVARDAEVSHTPGGSIVMAPHVQMFYVVLLNAYYNATGDEATLKELLPFARRIVTNAKAHVKDGETLARAYGFFPDNPFAVEQQMEDFSLINNAIYYQGLRAWNELTGEDAATAEAVKAELEAKLWDADEGYWSDAWDVEKGVRRRHYPLYGSFYISRFALEPKADALAATAGYMKRHFNMGVFLNMFDVASESHLADGNQLGAYYPVVDRTYWNVQNRARRLDALADFRRIVTAHGRVLTYPEGQGADVVNADPADYSDELGNKQFFSSKAWLSDALELNLGLEVRSDGLVFRPMSDGTPFAVRNLTVRGKRLDVVLRGRGTSATATLNGVATDAGFVPWSALAARNELVFDFNQSK